MKTLPLFKGQKILLILFIVISTYIIIDIFFLHIFTSCNDSASPYLVGITCGLTAAILGGIFNMNKLYFKYENHKIKWKLDVEKEVQEANIDSISEIKEDWKSIHFENNGLQYEIGTANLSKRQKKMIVNFLKSYSSRNLKSVDNR
ncbi:hypothetical protein N9E30_01070 [Flavobacteriales bacterium]|jgi:hypothetical protein|nr:hypothetical protein [Flavobacteriales bacterium]